MAACIRRRGSWTALVLLSLFPLGCGGGGAGGSGGGGDEIAFIDLGVFPAAAVVMGQSDFVSGDANQGGSTTASGMDAPLKSPAAGSLYVCDQINSRILGYATAPTTDNIDADFVIGQADFTSSASGLSATQLLQPGGVGSDGTRLAVADAGNDRVLLWSSLPTGNVAATTVLGQSDFVSSGAGTTATTMDGPQDVQLAGGRVFVVDTGNHRVLIWNTIPTTNGAPADVVLGQTDFTSNAFGATASSFGSNVRGLWSDGTRLVVADDSNHRVLIWNSIPTANGTPADVVLGQPDFTSRVAGLGASGLNRPTDVYSNGRQLFIADGANHRVVIHDILPTTNNRPADAVIGQGDFVHGSANDDNQDGVGDGIPSARTLRFPTGILALGSRLLVTDSDNHRVLIFEP